MNKTRPPQYNILFNSDEFLSQRHVFTYICMYVNGYILRYYIKE
jgi:hypothetical protein